MLRFVTDEQRFPTTFSTTQNRLQNPPLTSLPKPGTMDSSLKNKFIGDTMIDLNGITTYENRRHLPKGQGIYLVFGDGKLQYVGRSTDIHRRFRKVHTYAAEFRTMLDCTIGWISTQSLNDLHDIEADLIRMLTPPLNKHFCKDDEVAERVKNHRRVS